MLNLTWIVQLEDFQLYQKQLKTFIKMVIVVDDEGRENEGDLIMAASLVTHETMAFIVKKGTGIVCVGMKGEGLKRLELPIMVSQDEKDEKLSTTFTVSVISHEKDKLVERAAVAPIPAIWGPFNAYYLKSLFDGIEHIAMVKVEIRDEQDILVRVHSECLTGDIFGSARCDHGNQLVHATEQIEAAGRVC